jgi:hypothetical protein
LQNAVLGMISNGISLLSTNSMEQNPSRDVNSHAASQEIPYLLWNLKVHNNVHNTRYWSLSWAK